MPTGTLISVEEYLATSYRPDCDYVDGRIEERNLGELDHSSLQTAVAVFLRYALAVPASLANQRSSLISSGLKSLPLRCAPYSKTLHTSPLT